MKLSVVMMIKNEAEHLEKCLMSITPIQAAIDTEIIVVDTGSEDNSVEIAKKYTDRVYFHQWNNDFSAMRNITISYATGEWIFVLDGDEVIETPGEFINFFQSENSTKFNTGVIRVKSYSLKNQKLSTTGLIPRLFRNDKEFKYTGAIHEQPHSKPPRYFFKTNVLHYGYISDDQELMERKFIRNTEILKSELQKEPENLYYWFQLAQSYHAYGSNEEALEANLKAYEIAKKENKLINSMYIYTHLAKLYLSNKKYEELENICLEALALKDGYIDLYFMLALAQQTLGKTTEAIKSYNIYLDMLNHYEDFAGSKDTTVTTNTFDLFEEAYANLCTLYSKEKQFEKVLELKEKLHLEHLLRTVLSPIIKAHIKLNRYIELKEYYDKKILVEYKELLNDFTNCLEAEVSTLKKQDKNMIIDLFSNGDCLYSLLNLTRKEKELSKACIERFRVENFNKLPMYYGEILYYLIKNKQLDSDVLVQLSDRTLESNFGYLINLYKKECTENILSYMQEAIRGTTLDNARIRKVLGKVLLISEQFYGEIYEQIFKQYIKDGIYYINQVYNKNIIINEQIFNVKNEEEVMFLYMNKAEESKTHNKIEYVRYLKKALDIYPIMADGIKIFTNELENEQNKYKENIKEQIKALIDAGNLLRAHKLIHEYESLEKKDIQVLSMKAVIAIMEKRLNDAENIIIEGLNIEGNNFDLLYNLNYVYKSQGREAEAEVVQRKIAYSMPTRRYIDSSISLDEFFERINEENIRYVILSWSEKLPNIKQGESLAILVHDEDLVKISKCFIPYEAENAICCEVYSIKDYAGSTRAALPNYPESIAENILRNRVLYGEKQYTACLNDFTNYLDKK